MYLGTKITVMKQVVEIKRAYEPAGADDGFRVYVDRLWPRGLSHETFRYDMWDRDVAPSTQLREWFHADPDGRWNEFVRRYKAELRGSASYEALLAAMAGKPKVTLLYSSHDSRHNNAVVLEEMLVGSGAVAVTEQ